MVWYGITVIFLNIDNGPFRYFFPILNFRFSNSSYTSRGVRKPAFCICENKDADQLCGTAQLISAFVFVTWIVQSLFYLKPKFQASSYLLWLYSLVCVGPGRKPRRPVFSQRSSYTRGDDMKIGRKLRLLRNAAGQRNNYQHFL